MIRGIIIFFLVILSGLSKLYAQQSDFNDPVHKDIVYATIGDRKLLMDLYLPSNKKDPYLIIWIHGGAWSSGTKEEPPLGLLKTGYALASVEYRLSGDAIFPAQIHDLKAAVRFIRANSKKYNVRADRIVVWGSSAGGHLAALMGTSNNNKELEGMVGNHLNESSSVQGTIDFYGPTNFLTILQQSTPHGLSVRVPALVQLLGKPVDDVPELAKLASPVYQADPTDPPILIVHGDQDIQVPVNQSLELEAAFKKNGVLVELEILNGAGHGSSDYYSPQFYKKLELFLTKLFP